MRVFGPSLHLVLFESRSATRRTILVNPVGAIGSLSSSQREREREPEEETRVRVGAGEREETELREHQSQSCQQTNQSSNSVLRQSTFKRKNE